jgi:hypothetical protein
MVLGLARSVGNAAVTRAIAAHGRDGRAIAVLKAPKAAAAILRAPAAPVLRAPAAPPVTGSYGASVVAAGAVAMATAMARTREFARLFRTRTGRWPTVVEWNAWGHCFVAFLTARTAGSAGTRAVGTTIESFRTMLDRASSHTLTRWLREIPLIGDSFRHNSEREDLHNQRVGIELATGAEGNDPMEASLGALLAGRLLVAPADEGEAGAEIRG